MNGYNPAYESPHYEIEFCFRTNCKFNERIGQDLQDFPANPPPRCLLNYERPVRAFTGESKAVYVWGEFFGMVPQRRCVAFELRDPDLEPKPYFYRPTGWFWGWNLGFMREIFGPSYPGPCDGSPIPGVSAREWYMGLGLL